MKIEEAPGFGVTHSPHVLPGTVVVCEAEMTCEPDLSWLVAGRTWEPSGKLVAMVSMEDLQARPVWAFQAAAQLREEYVRLQENGRTTFIVFEEATPAR